jgi:hypothetical protein
MAARARYGADDTQKVTPRNDVYTGLLAVSLVGMLISCVLLGLDYAQYPEGKPEKLKLPNLPGVVVSKDKAAP